MNSDPNNPNSSPASRSGVEVKNRVVLQALSMSAGTFSSRLLGLLREVLLTAFFSRSVTDAWAVAFRLPNMFRRLLGEGSLSVSFIPVFVETQKLDPERARQLTHAVFTCLLFVLTVLTTLGVLFAEPIVRFILDESYALRAEQLELTVRMARIMFGFIFLVSTYAFWMGILNALGSFALAAMAPTLFNLAMIVSTLLPSAWFPSPGDGLAWGVMVGGFLQMIILIPSLRKKNFFPRWIGLKTAWKNPEARKVFRQMVPGLLGLGLLQISTLINQRFASELGEGALTYIYLADRLLELPLSLVSVSLGTALLPALSRHWSEGHRDQMSDTLAYYLRLNLYLVMAAGLGLFLLARPIVELFQRGQFKTEDVIATAGVVQVWALIMIPTSLVRVMAPAYYAVKNTWFPAVVSLVCLIVHLILAPRLMEMKGLFGLNLSSLISSSLNILLLLIFYPRFVHSFPFREVLRRVALFLLPLSGLAIVLQLYNSFETQWGGEIHSVARLILLLVFISAGAGVYFGISLVFRLEESQNTIAQLFSRLKRRVQGSGTPNKK